MKSKIQLVSFVTIAVSILITGCASFEGTKKLAENGNAKAQYELAQYYLNGSSDVKRNPKMAFDWLSKAAKAGNVDAMFKLGKCYKDGTGTPIDKKEALKWLRKVAIDNSNSEAAIYLGKWICSDEENNDAYSAIKCLMVPIKKREFTLGYKAADILQENAIILLKKVIKKGSSKKAKDFIRYFDKEVLYGRFASYFLRSRKKEVLRGMHEYYNKSCEKIKKQESEKIKRKRLKELARKQKESIARRKKIIMVMPINKLKALGRELSQEKKRMEKEEDKIASEEKKWKNDIQQINKKFSGNSAWKGKAMLRNANYNMKKITRKKSLLVLKKKPLLEKLKIVEISIKKQEELYRKIFSHKGNAYKYFDYGDSVKTIEEKFKLAQQKFDKTENGLETTYAFSPNKDIRINLAVLSQTGLYAYNILFTVQEHLEEAIIDKYTKKYGKPESSTRSKDIRYRLPLTTNPMLMMSLGTKAYIIMPNCKMRIFREVLSWKNKKEIVGLIKLKPKKILSIHYSGDKLEIKGSKIMSQEKIKELILLTSENMEKKYPHNTEIPRKVIRAFLLGGILPYISTPREFAMAQSSGQKIVKDYLNENSLLLYVNSAPLSRKVEAIIKAQEAAQQTKTKQELLAKKKAKEMKVKNTLDF